MVHAQQARIYKWKKKIKKWQVQMAGPECKPIRRASYSRLENSDLRPAGYIRLLEKWDVVRQVCISPCFSSPGFFPQTISALNPTSIGVCLYTPYYKMEGVQQRYTRIASGLKNSSIQKVWMCWMSFLYFKMMHNKKSFKTRNGMRGRFWKQCYFFWQDSKISWCKQISSKEMMNLY